MSKLFFIIILIFFIPFLLISAILPINSHNITSTFGEFRKFRLHAGIDFSTNHKIGFPIRAYRQGIIYRLKCDFRGYGKVIYLKHKDGSFSVYAHLSKFEDKKLKLEKLLKNFQKQKKRYFGIDEIVEKYNLKVKEGQIIGYSGESGAGFPHLHFELRKNIFTPFNPLLIPEISSQIKDNFPPHLKEIIILPTSPDSTIKGMAFPFKITSFPSSSSQKIKLTLPLQKKWSNYEILVKIIDKQFSKSSSHLGIYSFVLKDNKGEQLKEKKFKKFDYRTVKNEGCLFFNQIYSTPSHPFFILWPSFETISYLSHKHKREKNKYLKLKKQLDKTKTISATFADFYHNSFTLIFKKEQKTQLKLKPLNLSYFYFPNEKNISFKLQKNENYLLLSFPHNSQSFTFFPLNHWKIITIPIEEKEFFLITKKRKLHFYQVNSFQKKQILSQWEINNKTSTSILLEEKQLKSFPKKIIPLTSGIHLEPTGKCLFSQYIIIDFLNKKGISKENKRKLGLFLLNPQEKIFWIRKVKLNFLENGFYFYGLDKSPPQIFNIRARKGHLLTFKLKDTGKGIDWFKIKVTNQNGKIIKGIPDYDYKNWTSFRVLEEQDKKIIITVKDLANNITTKILKIKK